MPEDVATEQSKAFVVLNPVAGSSTPDQIRATLDTTFSAHGWTYTLYETQPNDDIAARVQQALDDGCELIIAGGGDGTVSLVANSLVGTDVPLGVLPVGTANVLARELGIPSDVEGAVALLVNEHDVSELDVMRVGTRHYILQIGIGLDSLMIKDTGRQAKRLFGRLAYMGTLVGKLFGYQSQRFTILVDGKRMRPRGWQVLVANAGTLGVAPFKWGPDIHPTDGELDLCIFNVRTATDYPRLLWQFVTGGEGSGTNVGYERIRKQVTISADRPLPIQADGEIIGETPVQVTVVPHALRLVVPKPVDANEQQRGWLGRRSETPDLPVQETQKALEQAISTIKTPEQAAQIVDELERAAGDKKISEVGEETRTPDSAQDAAQSITNAAADAPAAQLPQQVIAEAAAQVAATDDPADRQQLAEGIQRAMNPEASAIATPKNEEERRLLQEALMARLKPLQALDARIFLRVNRLPHPLLLNDAMYTLTTLMNRGDLWVAGLIIAALLGSKRARRAMIDVLPPLWLAVATVEYPVKNLVRRRRPFISLVQAMVIGKKPGHYSFPSGHSAAAFAGAWLLAQHFPRLRPLFYAVAALTGFSRTYLGAHYPGDVLSGATFGVILAAAYRYLIDEVGAAID